MLVIWGLYARRLDLVAAIKGIKLKQKTRTHTPQAKILEFLVAMLGGLAHLQDISRSAHPLDQNHPVAEAWGQPAWADYSGVSRSLSQLTTAEVAALMAALKAGARGYVLKGVTARDLANAVRVVAGGDIYISPALAGGILFELTANKQAHDPLTTLTDREREILQLVAEGLINREIGERLHLAEKTIKHYMTNVLQKLQVRSRVEAALLAQKHGLARE